MGGTGCPFDAELIILDNNNQAMRLKLATDTCAVFSAGGAYYDYSEGDNTEFFSLFGVDNKSDNKIRTAVGEYYKNNQPENDGELKIFLHKPFGNGEHLVLAEKYYGEGHLFRDFILSNKHST